jgi:hypothetical protein
MGGVVIVGVVNHVLVAPVNEIRSDNSRERRGQQGGEDHDQEGQVGGAHRFLKMFTLMVREAFSLEDLLNRLVFQSMSKQEGMMRL